MATEYRTDGFMELPIIGRTEYLSFNDVMAMDAYFSGMIEFRSRIPEPEKESVILTPKGVNHFYERQKKKSKPSVVIKWWTSPRKSRTEKPANKTKNRGGSNKRR